MIHRLLFLFNLEFNEICLGVSVTCLKHDFDALVAL